MTSPFPLYRARVLCALALTFPAAAFAEDELVVTAQPEETATSPVRGYLATRSNGASKSDRALVTTPQSVSVVTRQQMADQGAQDLNQALDYTPGVFTGFGGAATRYDTVSLRGFHGGDVDNTFLDGLRVMSDGGSFNVLQVDNWFLDRVDVIKGPASALYGQTVPGGLVNMVMKRPQFAREGHLQFSGGSHATHSAAFDYTDAINTQWAWRLSGITRNSHTQYQHTREEKYALTPQLLWQPDEDTSLLLRAYLQKDPSGGYHGSVPADGTLFRHRGRQLPAGFYEGDSARDQFKRHEQIYGYDFSHRLNDIWSLHATGSYSQSQVALDQVYQIGWRATDTDWLDRYYSGERSSLRAWASDNQLQAAFTTGAIAHRVTIGAEYHRYKNQLLTARGSASALNPWTGETAGEMPDTSWSAQTRRYYQSGLYLQDELQWDRWHLDLSGRYDRIVSENTTHRRQDDHVSGRAALLYAFDNGVSPYVSWSQAITPASLTDENGNQLKPTTAQQYEAGVKYQPAGTRNLYSLAVYDLTQQDVANRNVQAGTYSPSGKVQAQGIELEARTQLTDRFSTLAGYSLTHLRFRETVDGNSGHTPYVTPDSMASLWGHYQFDGGVSAGAGVRYIGRQWADNENTTRLPSVTLFDATLRADLGAWQPQLKGAWLQLNARNLTDKHYLAACYGTGYCYRGAERTLTATVGYDF
ncbi:TonB-dependent siderophore receptor [Candidatus Pantoea soli]|uniref:TonB-dependent siderophore receptor n=1 Tax=Candidatus Pantoea soli TaxID=3098669 RepID=A0A518XBY2_9GAMM|nr:TonB-dependent siderophore receptor [Pantoea soli]QDY41691.1 TonB-dependent siderophore receptor [Pantoea soli]